MPATWASATFRYCCQCCRAHSLMHAARLSPRLSTRCNNTTYWTAASCRVHASVTNWSRSGCRSCTSKDFWVVVAEGQCADCHDLRDSAESEVLGVPDLLHVPQALWCMPVGTITVSFCTSSYGLSKGWGRSTTVLHFLHQLHVFEDLAGIKLRWFLNMVTDAKYSR